MKQLYCIEENPPMNIRGNLNLIGGITKRMLEMEDKPHHSQNDVGKVC